MCIRDRCNADAPGARNCHADGDGTGMTEVPRVCVGIRSHRFGRAERDLYAALRECFHAEDIFIVLDETEQHVSVPTEFNKVAFDRAALEARALFAEHPRIGWLCGDYFYYALRLALIHI